MIHEARADSNKRHHEIQTEEMSFDEFLAPIRHPGTPDPTDLDLGFIAQEMERYPEVQRPRKIEEVVQYNRDGDDQGLANFRAIDPCEDVKAVGGERRKKRHIYVVQWACILHSGHWGCFQRNQSQTLAQIDQSAEHESQWNRHDDVGVSAFSVIHHEERDRRNDWYGDFVSPSNIENVIQKSKYRSNLQG